MSKCADYVFLFVRPSQRPPRAASEVTQVSTAAVSEVTEEEEEEEEGSSITTGGGERPRARRAVRRPRGRRSRTAAAMATEDRSSSTRTAPATCPMNSSSFTTPTRGDTTLPPGVHTAAHFCIQTSAPSQFRIIICIMHPYSPLAWIPHLSFGAIYRVGKKGCVFTQPRNHLFPDPCS